MLQALSRHLQKGRQLDEDGDDLESSAYLAASTGFDWEQDRQVSKRENRIPSTLRSTLKKGDGRLFPEYLLYCEGLEKPYFRGVMHLLASIVLPLGLLHLFREANRNPVGQFSAVAYVLSNIFCYGVSALYHLGRWSPRVEIFLQKLDHCGIAILSLGTFIPVTLLLFPQAASVLLITILLITCGLTCWHIIINNNPSVLRQVLVPASSLLFLPVFYVTLSCLEFTLYFVVVALQVAGVLVFVKRRPDPVPTVFGYHEVFHSLVVAAGLAVYVCNWSIIRRVCQPFAHEQNVLSIFALK